MRIPNKPGGGYFHSAALHGKASPAALGVKNMRMISCIVAVMFLLGCTSAPREKIVSVGMPFRDAAAVLKSVGARQVPMDMADQNEALLRTYDLVDGRVLLVVVVKSENKVSQMEICSNPDQPKAQRTWKAVQSVDVTKN